MVTNILIAINIVLAASLIGLILVQARGTGLGRTFGSSSVSFSRRGIEKVVFKSTFVVGALFIIVALMQLFV